MKYIKLTKGHRAMVDDDLYDWLNQWKWYYKEQSDGHGGYAARTLNAVWGGPWPNKTLRMHELILPPPPGYETDHSDINKLNNQRNNLRLATKSQQRWNESMRSTNSSGYKGIYWHKRDKKWRVQLGVNYKKVYIGNYAKLEDAIEAYKKAVNKYHGEFGRSE
jgi:hypothetical protein